MAFSSIVDRLIWFFFSINVLIDALNGFFLLQLGVNVGLSMALKGGVTCLIIINMMRYQIEKLLLVMLLVILSYSFAFLRAIFYNIDGIALEFTMIFRITYIACVFIYCCICVPRMISMNGLSEKIECILLFSYFVVAFNVLIGYVGLGFSTYVNTGIGFKGYFFAGNELGALFIVLSFFSLSYSCSKGSLVYIPMLLLNLVVGVSIGTKAAILGSVLSIPMVLLTQGRLSIKVSVFFVFFSVAIIASLRLEEFYQVVFNSSVWDKLMHDFSSRELVSALFSSRDRWVEEVFLSMSNESSLLMLFGAGSSYIESIIGKQSVEIDFIDLFLYFGLLSFIFLFFHAYLVMFTYRKRNQSKYGYVVFSVNLILLFLSFTSGHIWMSGMLPISWFLLNSLIYIRSAK